MRALNALHYPSLVRQQKVFHRWWTGLTGLFLGCGVAWGWQQWQAIQTAQLQQAQSHLQTTLTERTQWAKEAARQQTQTRLQAEQAGHLKQIAEHQQAWVALHDSLQQEAQARGLRLARLQVEAEKIEFQGIMPRFEAMSDAQQSVSAQLPNALALTSMTVAPKDEVNFVWQATWPASKGAWLTSPASPLQTKP